MIACFQPLALTLYIYCSMLMHLYCSAEMLVIHDPPLAEACHLINISKCLYSLVSLSTYVFDPWLVLHLYCPTKYIHQWVNAIPL